MNFKKIIALTLTVCLLVMILCVPAFAAVTEGNGDGYALFNGIKMPSISPIINSDGSSAFGYALIVKLGGGYYFLALNSLPFVRDSSIVFPAGTMFVLFTYGASNVWVDVDRVLYETEHSESLSEMPLIWTNTDILNNSNNTVYLAASDPIPLDGMTVIEWDGDTTGLPVLVEFPYGLGAYYVVDSDIIAVDDVIGGVFVAEGTDADNNTSRQTYTINSSTVVSEGSFWSTEPYAVASGTLDGNSGTGFIVSELSGVNAYTSLFAYRTSAEEPPDEGGTDDPQPPFGVARFNYYR